LPILDWNDDDDDDDGDYPVDDVIFSLVYRKVHNIDLRLRPPVKISTPYGGRLVWKLPGNNTLTVHLKDNANIRNKKRWSQV